MSKIVNDAIKFAEKEYNLVYDKKTKVLKSKDECKSKIHLTKEFLEDVYAYFGLKPKWLVDRLFVLYGENADAIDIDICVKNDKKGYYDHSQNKLVKFDVYFIGKRSNGKKKIIEKYTIPIQH